jgi:hypothetical protein
MQNLIINYKVVDKKIFNETLDNIDTSCLLLKNDIIDGTLIIKPKNANNWRYITGTFDVKEYVNEYGFKLIKI